MLYINDLPCNILSEVYMFADDTKVFRIITSIEDQQLLQCDLDSLAKWSDKWLLKFHPDKCKLMHLGKQATHQCVYKLKTGNTLHIIEGIEEERDICVVIDSKLQFDKHIYGKINKASSLMAVIRRSFTTLNVTNFSPLYNTLVRSHLEYASCIWSPTKKSMPLKEYREGPRSSFQV